MKAASKLLIVVVLLLPLVAMAGPIPDSLGIPDPLPMTCTAQQTCPNQCYISCGGSSTCTVQSTSVTCDSVTTSCPYPTCTPSAVCVSAGLGCDFCACKAQGFGNLYCSRAAGCIEPIDPGHPF